MKTQFKQPEMSPGYLLWKLTTDWQRRLRVALTEFNITHVQFVYLACLMWQETYHNNQTNQQQIATLAQLDKMVVSDTTKKLLTQKLITRTRCSIDGRQYNIRLTQHGKQIINAAIPVVEDIDKEYFKTNQHLFDKMMSVAYSK